MYATTPSQSPSRTITSSLYLISPWRDACINCSNKGRGGREGRREGLLLLLLLLPLPRARPKARQMSWRARAAEEEVEGEERLERRKE